MFRNRYSITSDTAISKITGNEGCLFMGWALGLPEQAHEFILTSSSEKIKNEKKFFLPYERNLPTDKLLADLRFSKSIGVIPMYIEVLPVSERVFTISSVSITIPTQFEDLLKNETRKIKQSIVKLNSIKKEDAVTHLGIIKYEFEDLLEHCINKNFLTAKILCYEFPSGISTDIHFAFLITDFKKDCCKKSTI